MVLENLSSCSRWRWLKWHVSGYVEKKQVCQSHEFSKVEYQLGVIIFWNNFDGMLCGCKDMMLENLRSYSRRTWLKWCISWYEDQIRYKKSKESAKWTINLGKLDSKIILIKSCVVEKIWCWKIWVAVVGGHGWSDMYHGMKIKSGKKYPRIQ